MTRVLFVDDDAHVLDGLKRRLRASRLGWNVDFVDSAEAALGRMTAQPPDVLVTDFMMSGMKGDELIVRVRERFPETKPIVLSGQCPTADAVALVQQGVEFLAKPCDFASLVRTITEVASLRAASAAVTVLAGQPFRIGGRELLETVSLMLRGMVAHGLVKPDDLPPGVRAALREAEGRNLLGGVVKEAPVDTDLSEVDWLQTIAPLYDADDRK